MDGRRREVPASAAPSRYFRPVTGIDLHTHSTASDGTLTPAELMAAAREWFAAQSVIVGHGNQPTIADLCVASQVFGAQLFGFELTSVPTVMRIFGECMKLEAFDRAQPLKQPGAPAKVQH